MTQPNVNPATDLAALLEQLANTDMSNATDAQRLEVDKFVMAQHSAMSSDRRSDIHKLEVAEALARLNAKGIKLFKAVDQFYRDTGDNISIRLSVTREKDSKGVWQYRFTSLPSKKADEVWLPGGKDLVFIFKGVRHVNTYIKDGETKTSRGSKAASESLCKAIGKNTSGSTASTSIKRELEKLDSDGNPGGTSQFRTQLEDCWILHPSVNNGVQQKLTEYFLALDGLDEATDEEDGNAEDESES
jgi:hypothetical protein